MFITEKNKTKYIKYLFAFIVHLYSNKKIPMNKYVEILYQEHEIIKKAIETVKGLKPLIEKDPAKYKSEMGKYISFFRKYADGFHHYKEEQILFPEMGKRNEFLAEGVIKEMLDNHNDFRDMIGDIESNVNSGDYNTAHSVFERYAENLLDHIAVEDDELFLIPESIFDEAEMEKIYFRFMDCDAELGLDNKKQWEAI